MSENFRLAFTIAAVMAAYAMGKHDEWGFALFVFCLMFPIAWFWGWLADRMFDGICKMIAGR